METGTSFIVFAASAFWLRLLFAVRGCADCAAGTAAAAAMVGAGAAVAVSAVAAATVAAPRVLLLRVVIFPGLRCAALLLLVLRQSAPLAALRLLFGFSPEAAEERPRLFRPSSSRCLLGQHAQTH